LPVPEQRQIKGRARVLSLQNATFAGAKGDYLVRLWLGDLIVTEKSRVASVFCVELRSMAAVLDSVVRMCETSHPCGRRLARRGEFAMVERALAVLWFGC
jgi:hypothetical protein